MTDVCDVERWLLSTTVRGRPWSLETLQNGDFQAAAAAVQAATLSNAASNGVWSTASLNAAGIAAVNKTGTTQMRVYFNLDDNDDTGNDYLGYCSGENGTTANRPQLVVTYQ